MNWLLAGFFPAWIYLAWILNTFKMTNQDDEVVKKIFVHFVVLKVLCPNDWQQNQFHINPKKQRCTIPLLILHLRDNHFCPNFSPGYFCSYSDRINLWRGRTIDRPTLTRFIRPLLPNASHETCVQRMQGLIWEIHIEISEKYTSNYLRNINLKCIWILKPSLLSLLVVVINISLMIDWAGIMWSPRYFELMPF